jgi:hypothetical protein
MYTENNPNERVIKISRSVAEAIVRKLDTYHDRMVLSAYWDILLCEFDHYHDYIEQLLGRPVMINELCGEQIRAQISEASRAEAEAILGKKSLQFD